MLLQHSVVEHKHLHFCRRLHAFKSQAANPASKWALHIWLVQAFIKLQVRAGPHAARDSSNSVRQEAYLNDTIHHNIKVWKPHSRRCVLHSYLYRTPQPGILFVMECHDLHAASAFDTWQEQLGLYRAPHKAILIPPAGLLPQPLLVAMTCHHLGSGPAASEHCLSTGIVELPVIRLEL